MAVRFFPLTTLSNAGFTSQNFGDAMTARAGILAHASGAADQRSKNIEIAENARVAATKAKEAECGLRGPRCREYEKTEQQKFGDVAEANAAPIEAEPAISAADPAAHMLDKLLHPFGVTERSVQYMRVILMTVALTTAGLLL